MSSRLQLFPIASPAVMKKSSVCRCLFGRADPETKESIRSDLKKAMDEDLGVARLRWGFDFEDEAPTSDGPYQWTELSNTDEEIPAFYREDRHKSRRKVKSVRGRLRRNLFPENSADDSSEPTLVSFSSDRRKAESNMKLNSVYPQDVSISTSTKADLDESSLANIDTHSALVAGGEVSKNLVNLTVPDLTDGKGVTGACGSTSGTSSSNKEARISPKTVQSSIFGYMKVKKRKASYNIVPASSSSKGGSSSKRLKTLR